jgi:hypothetical protein
MGPREEKIARMAKATANDGVFAAAALSVSVILFRGMPVSGVAAFS